MSKRDDRARQAEHPPPRYARVNISFTPRTPRSQTLARSVVWTLASVADSARRGPYRTSEGSFVGSVIKKRRKRMAKKKHRKLLKKTRVQRRNKK